MHGVQPVGARDFAYSDVFVVDDGDEDEDEDGDALGRECGRLLRAQQQQQLSDAGAAPARAGGPAWLPSRRSAWVALCVVVWFTFSISLTVYNKCVRRPAVPAAVPRAFR